jgi:Fe-S cluster biogenesis protein NfuA
VRLTSKSDKSKLSSEPRELLVAKIIAALEEARQYAQSHGGDLRLNRVDDRLNVYVVFLGACKSCPLSEVTLRLHIERILRDKVPQIKKVSIDND